VCPHCNITNGCLFDGNDCADYDPTRPMIEDCSNSIDDDCDGLIDNDDPDCWYVDLDDPSTWDPDNDGISNVENVSGEYLIDQDVRLVNKIYNIPSNSPTTSHQQLDKSYCSAYAFYNLNPHQYKPLSHNRSSHLYLQNNHTQEAT